MLPAGKSQRPRGIPTKTIVLPRAKKAARMISLSLAPMPPTRPKLRETLFFVWATLSEHEWVTFGDAEARRLALARVSGSRRFPGSSIGGTRIVARPSGWRGVVHFGITHPKMEPACGQFLLS